MLVSNQAVPARPVDATSVVSNPPALVRWTLAATARGMSYYRTPEHRRLRAELIQRWKPWEQSTGPRTADGKATSARNGYKGGERQSIRALAKFLRSLEGSPSVVAYRRPLSANNSHSPSVINHASR